VLGLKLHNYSYVARVRCRTRDLVIKAAHEGLELLVAEVAKLRDALAEGSEG